MPKRSCSVATCERPLLAKGYCTGHYQRWKKTGSPGTAALKTQKPRVGHCSVVGCDRPDHSNGYCVCHYYRERRTGDAGPPFPSRNAEDRFAAKVQVDPVTGCWRWTGKLMPNGYGVFSAAEQRDYAHRVSYEMHIGPIPVGMEIDHLCHTNDPSCHEGDDCPHRSCVNPDHLEPVTHRVNCLRGRGFAAVAARKTHCLRGHEYTPGNTYVKPNGTRRCRTCQRSTSMKSYRKRNGLAA